MGIAVLLTVLIFSPVCCRERVSQRALRKLAGMSLSGEPQYHFYSDFVNTFFIKVYKSATDHEFTHTGVHTLGPKVPFPLKHLHKANAFP